MIESLELWKVLALAGAGFVAGFVNVVAGGGSLLVMPLLVFLGVPEGTANGTTRVAIFVQNAVAAVAYGRRGELDFGMAKKLVPPAMLGALAGGLIGVRLSDAGVRVLLGWVMLGCAALAVWNPRPAARAPAHGWLRVWPLMLGVGLYGGLIQAGVGYLILAGLTLVASVPLLQANIQKVVLVFAYTPIALLVFSSEGKVDYVLGAVLALGQALGGWFGALAALERGERLIRALLVLAVLASALKLLLD
jgi:uncharacterized membrane protein YfcA